ncbi:MAG: beta-propeller domain-containing protein [Eubacteriales bacterium]
MKTGLLKRMLTPLALLILVAMLAVGCTNVAGGAVPETTQLQDTTAASTTDVPDTDENKPDTFKEEKLPSAKDGTMTAFTSLDQFKTFLLAGMTGGATAVTGERDEAANDSGKAVGAVAPVAPQTNGGNEAVSHGDTNVQVKGIDEADIIKNDGKYIYILSQNSGSLSIVEAYPANSMKVVAKIKTAVDNKYYYSMFVQGDNLILLYNEYKQAPAAVTPDVKEGTASEKADGTVSSDAKIAPDIAYMPMGKSLTGVDIYDISDRSAPKLARSVKMEGGYINSRVKDGILYLITSKYNNIYYMTRENAAQVKDTDILPVYYDSLKGEDEIVIPATDISFAPSDSYNYNSGVTIITALELSSKDAPSVTSYVGDSYGTVYMSMDNIYITQQTWNNDKTYTMIHKFGVDKTSVKYVATGKVEGYSLNQFSADEYNSNFRIATTDWNSGNNLYVLDKDMKTVGSITGLAKGEQIKSARFSENTAYMVTFETTDPLYVVDLSDPAKPAVKGELKLPGFSSYLHPVGDSLIIGVGQSTAEQFYRDEDGKEIVTGFINTGLKASLFDVSDPQNPKEISSLKLGGMGSWADFLYDHKGFLDIADRDMFAVRGNFTAVGSTDYANEPLAKLVSYSKENGLKLAGSFKGEDSYDTGNRMTYIGDTLYHLTGRELVAYSFDGLKKQGAVEYSSYVVEDTIYTDGVAPVKG